MIGRHDPVVPIGSIWDRPRAVLRGAECRSCWWTPALAWDGGGTPDGHGTTLPSRRTALRATVVGAGHGQSGRPVTPATGPDPTQGRLPTRRHSPVPGVLGTRSARPPTRLVRSVRRSLVPPRHRRDVAVCDQPQPPHRLIGLIPIQQLLPRCPGDPRRATDGRRPTGRRRGPGSRTGSVEGSPARRVQSRRRRCRRTLPRSRSRLEATSVLLRGRRRGLRPTPRYLASTETARLAAEEPHRRRLCTGSPWLVLGPRRRRGVWLRLVGLFEGRFTADVRLAFFIPGVVYLADAVGTQTEALIVRGLSVGAPVRTALPARDDHQACPGTPARARHPPRSLGGVLGDAGFARHRLSPCSLHAASPPLWPRPCLSSSRAVDETPRSAAGRWPPWPRTSCPSSLLRRRGPRHRIPADVRDQHRPDGRTAACISWVGGPARSGPSPLRPRFRVLRLEERHRPEVGT